MFFDVTIIPCFSGDDSFKIETYLKTIQVAANLLNWSDLQTQAATLLRLTGTAWQYMTLYEYPFCDWSEISKILLQRFSPTFPSFIAHQKLCECLQYSGEPLLKFALRVQYFGEKYKMTLVDADSLAAVDFIEKLKVLRFVNGLLSGKMRIALMRKDPRCLMEALDFAMEEEYWENINNYCGENSDDEMEPFESIYYSRKDDDFVEIISEICHGNLMCVDELESELLVDNSDDKCEVKEYSSDDRYEMMLDCDGNNKVDLCENSDLWNDYDDLSELKIDYCYDVNGNANVTIFHERQNVLNDKDNGVYTADNQSYVGWEMDSARKSWMESRWRYEDMVQTCGADCEWRSMDFESVWVRNTAEKRGMTMDTSPILPSEDISNTAATEKGREDYRMNFPVKNRGA